MCVCGEGGGGGGLTFSGRHICDCAGYVSAEELAETGGNRKNLEEVLL